MSVLKRFIHYNKNIYNQNSIQWLKRISPSVVRIGLLDEYIKKNININNIKILSYTIQFPYEDLCLISHDNNDCDDTIYGIQGGYIDNINTKLIKNPKLLYDLNIEEDNWLFDINIFNCIDVNYSYNYNYTYNNNYNHLHNYKIYDFTKKLI
jgi:hypothetical protein